MPHSRIRMVDRLGIQECSIKATHVHQFPLQFLNPKEGVQKNIRKPYKAFRKIESEPQWPMQQSDTVVKRFTFKFQFIRACFPETSESFTNKSLGETLPRVSGSLEVFVDDIEHRSPREGPEITSKVRLLPALLTERYGDMFQKLIQMKDMKNIKLFI